MNSSEKKKILVVDDEHLTTELAKVILEKHNFSVIIAEDGETALSLAQRENPDLILLDAVLPTMDGFTVCKKLRENKGFKNVPILMLTAKGSSNDIEKGRAAGADEYIIKPFSGKALVATIRRHLGMDE
ncbi:MAG: two-component system response regulator [Candidatus Thorarchaeota archaeon]|nr:MAG: two-component system response regulator [Candidatus Thorarchaeota archaeon]